MLDPVRAKARILGLTTATFFGGVLLASGMEWTTGSHAATLLQQPPSRSETRPLAELSEAFVAISEAVTPAVVSIYTETTRRPSEGRPELPDEYREFFRMPQGEDEPVPMEGGGTGFLITEDGYVMTNNHVVEGAETIRVTLLDRSVHDARVVGRDPTTDVAVIKLEGRGFPAVRFGDPTRTKVGEWVLAIGNPLTLDFTVTAGIVSAKGRPLEILRQSLGNTPAAGYAIETFIQTDAAINPGNSGGPLVNINGEVIGVNSAIASQTGLNIGYGFAVPIDLARRVADDLIRYGQVRRPILGVAIADVDAVDAEYFDLPSVGGVLIYDFSMPDSPAEQAGLQPLDVIISVDGVPVTQVNELQARVLTRRPGEEVELEVVRKGEVRRFEVRLVEADEPALLTRRPEEAPAPQGTLSPTGRLGVTVVALTAEMAREAELVGPPAGVVVTEVRRASPASGKVFRGQRVTAVDETPVATPQDLDRVLQSKQPGEIVGLHLLGGDGRRSIATVRIPAPVGNGD
jgi:serine protease Do